MPTAPFKSRTDGRQSQTGALRAARASNWRRRISAPAVILTMLLSAFFLIQSCVPLRTAIQIGADEGFELAKATLCLKGYKLYSEVWNDQPPLHTFLITQVLEHISPSILGPRLVTSVFAAVLLASLFFITLRGSGLLVAALATAFLIVSPGFIELSSSCMLEIPALALAVTALGVWLALPPIMNRDQAKLPTHPQPLHARGQKTLAPLAGSPPRRGQGWVPFRILLRPDSAAVFRAKWPVREIIAGVLFGIAFQMKLVNVILLPLAVLMVWLRQHESAFSHCPNQPAPDSSPEGNTSRATSRHADLFRSLRFLAASLALSFLTIDYLLDRGAFLLHFGQSWSSHFGSAKSFEYGSANDHPFDWSIFLKNWDTTLPALLGIGLLLWAKLRALYSRDRMRLGSPSLRLSPTPSAGERVSGGRATVHFASAGKAGMAMVPFAWLGLTLIVFATHKPWWSYYYIHLAIPLCLCAAIGVQAAWRWLHRRRHLGLSLLLGVFAICAVGWMGSRVYLQISGIRHSPQTYSSLVLGEIQRLKPFARFIYTDESIYSFHTGIPMPPDLAVLPLKRLWSGDMTNARVAEELRTIKPEVILLRNDAREVPFQDLIDAEYRVVYQDADRRLYTRKALAKQAGY